MSSYNPPIENLGIFDSNVFNSQTDTTGSIHFLDGSIQTSSYTGAKSLKGSYTNTNLTIDANGKITALANGSGGAGSQTLSQTLALGNSAGIYNIDLSGNQLQNCSQITASANLNLNPVGSISCNGNTKITGNCEVTGQLTAPPYFLLPYPNSTASGGDIYYCQPGLKSFVQINTTYFPSTGNTIMFSPYYIQKTTTFNRLATRQAATGTPPTIYLGIYSQDPITGLPKDLIVSTSMTMAATAGALIGIIPPTTLNRGYYWSAFLVVGTYSNNTIEGLTSTDLRFTDMFYQTNILNGNIYCPTYVLTAGSLPATISTSLTRFVGAYAIPFICLGVGLV